MEFEKSVSFKNWSSTEFIGRFDAQDYTFAAGGVYNVPSSMALHFAKQLAVQELHALGTVKGEMLSEPDVKEYMDKCFPTKATSSNALPNSFERIDIVTDAKAEPAKELEDANKTITEEQQETSEDDEADTSDDKNNAGAPVFKGTRSRPKTRDAEYVKA